MFGLGFACGVSVIDWTLEIEGLRGMNAFIPQPSNVILEQDALVPLTRCGMYTR